MQIPKRFLDKKIYRALPNTTKYESLYWKRAGKIVISARNNICSRFQCHLFSSAFDNDDAAKVVETWLLFINKFNLKMPF